MTLCPIAIVASCAKCPAFKVCPLKGVLGDHKAEPAAPAKTAAAKKKSASKERRVATGGATRRGADRPRM